MKHCKPFLTLFSVILFFTACKKDKNDQPTDNRKTYLMKEIYSFGTVEYGYDSQNRLIRSVYTDNANSNNNTTITVTKFNSAGLIEEMLEERMTSSDVKAVFTYNTDNKIEKMSYYVLTASGQSHFYDYLYNLNSGRLLYSKKSIATGVVELQTETWIDANGNFSQVKFYTTSGTLASTSVYNSFDDKKTFTSLLPAAIGGRAMKNNYTGVTSTNAATGEVRNFTYTYEYNADGYPVKRTATSSTSSSASVATYVYEKR